MSVKTTGPFCVECRRDRSNDPGATDTPDHAACPDCGSASLQYAITIHETVKAITDSITTSLRPGVQDRDWQLRWSQLQLRLTRFTHLRSEPRSADAINSAAQDLLEFFVSAYHLSDALVEDGAVSKRAVENAMKRNYVLALLRDLATQDKHRILRSQTWSGNIPVWEVSDVSEGTGWRLVMTIRHDGKELDGVRFASEVIDAWNAVLKAFRLV